MSTPTNGLTPHDVLAAAVTDAGGSPCQSDPELFFGDQAQQIEAQDKCLECPGFLACIEYITNNPEPFGTWGGLTEHDRYPRRRNKKAK